MSHPFPPGSPVPGFPQRPVIAMGWSSSLLGSFRGIGEAVEETQLYSADLDLRASLIPPGPNAFKLSGTAGPLRVRNLWLPARINGPFALRRAERLDAFIIQCLATDALRSIVIPGNVPQSPGIAVLPRIKLLIAAREISLVQLAYGLDAAALSRNPRHLQQLSMVRHFAEEWDMGLALDMTGPIYPGWEAEAAVMRLMPRLKVVRMPIDVSQRTYAGRTLAMLADQGYAALISASANPMSLVNLIRPQSTLGQISELHSAIQSEFDRRNGAYPLIEPLRPDLTAFDLP